MHSPFWTTFRFARRLSCALSLVGLGIPANPTWAQTNDCATPYWQDTLRCAVAPNDPPQANFNTRPVNASEVKDFTRVFLTNNPAIRCADGTRPLIYVDKAVGTPSNKWIFSMTGGGSCHAQDSDGDDVIDDAQDCLNQYTDPQEYGEMGTASEPPMKNFEGINRPDALRNPVFAGYNRVRVQKCSYDRYNGRVAYEAAGGYFSETGPGGVVVDFNLYQQGYLIMEEALAALQSGLTYTTWTVSNAGGPRRVVEVQDSLPPLANAEKVLFVAHSGGAHGLFHNIDYLATSLAAIPGFAGDVRALFDANFIESIENEAAFATDAGGMPLNGDAYSTIWTGNTTGDGVPFVYDGAAYYAAGYLVEQYNSWQAAFDSSCLAAHAATGDDWKCRDRYHILFNHIATPFFYREDFTDPGEEHTNHGLGHFVEWGAWDAYPHCPVGFNPCPPLFTVEEHRTRLTQQFQTLLDKSAAHSELATGVDPSLGAGNFPTFHAWMPSCNSHNGAYQDEPFYDTTVSYKTFTHSMRTWLEGFMRVGRTNLRSWRVDEWADSSGNVMTSTCP